MKRNVILGFMAIALCFSLTGCGQPEETPAAGVSIANAEGQTLGFTYLYDLGNGYKLYADNFTKIVYLKYDFTGGKGATSIGSSSMCPYISPNGNYYKVNTQTRVIEEYISNGNTQNTNQENATTVDIGTSSSQKSDIEAILNENGQKNENSNNQQKIETEQQQSENGAITTSIESNNDVQENSEETTEPNTN